MKELHTFIEAIEKEDFIEGHECLEDVWREWKNHHDTKEESYILKALINASTALALHRLGRIEGAKKVWGTYEKYKHLNETINSSHTKLYKKAYLLLDKKHKEVFTYS